MQCGADNLCAGAVILQYGTDHLSASAVILQYGTDHLSAGAVIQCSAALTILVLVPSYSVVRY